MRRGGTHVLFVDEVGDAEAARHLLAAHDLHGGSGRVHGVGATVRARELFTHPQVRARDADVLALDLVRVLLEEAQFNGATRADAALLRELAVAKVGLWRGDRGDTQNIRTPRHLAIAQN